MKEAWKARYLPPTGLMVLAIANSTSCIPGVESPCQGKPYCKLEHMQLQSMHDQCIPAFMLLRRLDARQDMQQQDVRQAVYVDSLLVSIADIRRASQAGFGSRLQPSRPSGCHCRCQRNNCVCGGLSVTVSEDQSSIKTRVKRGLCLMRVGTRDTPLCFP